jgi:hypothetical protein
MFPRSVYAYTTLLSSPSIFYLDQVPSYPNSPFTPQAELLTHHLGNVYLLLAGLAVVCTFTSSATTARNYLLVVALGDLGHIGAVYRVFGHAKFVDVGGWNDMTWGSVGVSAFLFVNRLATVGGVFGRIRT